MMKKTLLFWSAAVCLLLGACSKDETAAPAGPQPEPEPKPEVKTERLYLSDETTEAEANPASRAYFADGYKIAWEEGDQVAASSTEKYPVQQDAEGRWYVELPSADEYTLFYPAVALGATLPENSNTVCTLPATQTYRAGSFDDTALLARALSKPGGKLVFNYLCSVMKLNLLGTSSELVKQIRIDALGGEKISSLCEVVEDERGTGYVRGWSSGDHAAESLTKVELNTDNVALTSTGVTFYLTLMPVTFSQGFRITITLSDGRQMVRTGGVGQTAARGRILAMPALRFEDTDSTAPVYYSTDNLNWRTWKYDTDGKTPLTLAYPQTADHRLYFKDNGDAAAPGLKAVHFQSLHDTFMTDGDANGNAFQTVVAKNPIGFDFSQAKYESDVLPAAIFTRCGETANAYNTNMRYISLPYNIREIADKALCWNLVLHTVILPPSVEKIGALVFEVSRGLHSTGDSPDPQTQGVFCYATTPPSFGANAFNWNNGNFHVPASSLSAYEAVWSADPSGAKLYRMTLVGDL